MPKCCCVCLQALEFMHKQSVAHGDIHSENILVGSDGGVKIADFGLCIIFEDERNSRQKEVKIINSDVPEIPSAVPEVHSTLPEMLMGKEKATKMDILRLGMTVSEMFDREIPFYDLLELWSHNPGNPKITCSLQFLDLVDSCLEEDVTHRLSASELLQHPFLELASSLEDLKPLVLAAKMEEIDFQERHS